MAERVHHSLAIDVKTVIALVSPKALAAVAPGWAPASPLDAHNQVHDALLEAWSLQAGQLTQWGLASLHQGAQVSLGYNHVFEWNLRTVQRQLNINLFTHFCQLETQSRDVSPPERDVKVV